MLVINTVETANAVRIFEFLLEIATSRRMLFSPVFVLHREKSNVIAKVKMLKTNRINLAKML